MESDEPPPSTACSACGLPPHKDAEGEEIPLRRCSRCHQAWYHNVQCQKQHFPQHKIQCRKLSTSLTHAPSSPSDARSLPFKVEKRTGKGNSLVATQPISKYDRILPSITAARDDGWKPFVPPVLMEQSRTHQCALCFQDLDNKSFQFLDGPSSPTFYEMHFCSTKCREQGRRLGFHKEYTTVASWSQMPFGQSAPSIFSTAILLYRLFTQVVDSETKRQLSKLQCHLPPNMTDNDENSPYHAQAVVATTLTLLQVGHPNMSLPSAKNVLEMLMRVRLNSFTIVDNMSNECLGIAIFSTPSFMNHSCDPNVLQTFMYGEAGNAPKIILTAIKDILPGQELHISYVDCNAPFRHVRRDSLFKTYFFVCDCSRCQVESELNQDDLLKFCLDCTNKGNPIQGCAGCQKVKASAQRYVEDMAAIQTQASLGNKEEAFSDVERLNRLFENAMCITATRSSLAVQEAGEWLVQALQKELTALPENDPREARTIVRIVKVLGEVLADPLKPSAAISLVLRRNLQNFDAAKYILSIDPNPAFAIGLLQEVRELTSKVYHDKSPFMNSVRAALESVR